MDTRLGDRGALDRWQVEIEFVFVCHKPYYTNPFHLATVYNSC